MAAKSTSISRWCPWFWIGFAFHWFPLKLVGTKNCEHLSILVIRSSLLESTAHGEAGWGWHGVQRQGSWSFSCNESFNELQWAAMGTHMLKIYLILIWSHISKHTHTQILVLHWATSKNSKQLKHAGSLRPQKPHMGHNLLARLVISGQ